MNPFSDLYKTLKTIDLIKIIDNPKDYQPFAVETAKAELSARQLSDEEMADLRIEIRNKRKEEVERKKTRVDKFQKSVSKAVDIIDPLRNEKPSASKIIAITSIVFAFISAWQIFTQFGLIRFMLFNTSENERFKVVIYIVISILPLIGTILFWLRKKLGWLFLTAFVVCSALGDIILFPKTLMSHDSIPAIDSLIPTASPGSVLLMLLFHGGFVYILLKKDMRLVYNVDRKALILMSVLVIVLTGMTQLL